MELIAVDKDITKYEEAYHTARHPNHENPDYYEARGQVALRKFFKGFDTNSRILDFGCGYGQNMYYLKNSVGYDLSKYTVEFCRKKGKEATNSLEDIPDESCDIVFTAHVLEHHPNPKEMIDDMRSKLKPGKNLILVIPYERHGKAKFELDLNQHLFMWNFQNINNLLLMNGFKIKENRYIRGTGYNKLLFLAKINFGLYYFATNLLSRLLGIKEIMVVAEKK